MTASVAKMAQEKGATSVIICAAIEEEIAQLESAEEKKEFLEAGWKRRVWITGF